MQDRSEYDAQQKAAYEARDLKAIKKAAEAHKELLKPVYAMADQMVGRLEGLLTTAQIQQYQERQQAAEVVQRVRTQRTSSTDTKKAKADGSPEPVGTNGDEDDED